MPERNSSQDRTTSYWQSQLRLQDHAPNRLPSTSHVVVIGGGVIGVSVAYWLAKSGRQTVLIERGRLGSGASGRNAGLFLPGRSPLEDARLVEAVFAEENIHADFVQTGHLALTSNPRVWASFCREAESSNARVLALHRSGCEDLLNLPLAKGFLGGRFFPHGRVIHPIRFVYSIADAARRHGAMIATNTEVVRVVAGIGRADLTVETTVGTLRARTVVYACSAGVVNFAPQLADVLVPMRGQMLSTHPYPAKFDLGMALDRGTVYWRQTSNGVVLLGGFRNRDPTTETGFADVLNPRLQHALELFLPRVFPGLPAARAQYRWTGIMDCTPDGKPVIGLLAGKLNQWVAAGFGGHGMPAALGVGRQIARGVLNNYIPEPIRHLNPMRFSKLSAIPRRRPAERTSCFPNGKPTEDSDHAT